MISSILFALLSGATSANANITSDVIMPAGQEAEAPLITAEVSQIEDNRDPAVIAAELDESGWDGKVEIVNPTAEKTAFFDFMEETPAAPQAAPSYRGRARRERGGNREHFARSGGGCSATGQASWYGPGFNGHRTASGEPLNPGAMTAAHRSLPFGTMVRVTNRNSGRSIVVRINDRGPFNSKIIDLSSGAARAIGMGGSGPVQLDCA